MDEARGWLIGLAVAAILGVGILAWVHIDPAPAVSEVSSEETEFSIATQGSSNSWEDATPNFAAGDVADEHHGGESESWGKLTVQDLCLQEEIDLELAESRLETYGLALDPSLRIRELADSSDYKPSEVADILRGNEPGAGCDDPDCDCDDHSESSAGHKDHECDDESSSDGESEDHTDND
jgi:hypothetical protein